MNARVVSTLIGLARTCRLVDFCLGVDAMQTTLHLVAATAGLAKQLLAAELNIAAACGREIVCSKRSNRSVNVIECKLAYRYSHFLIRAGCPHID